MKKILIIAVLTAIITFGATGTFAAETMTNSDEKGLEQELGKTGLQFREKIQGLLNEYKGITNSNIDLKAAGASYQKSLTAKADDLSRYTKGEQQRMMAGVYTFDAEYAALFLQKKDMAKFLDARNTLNEKIGVTIPLPSKMKKRVQNTDSIPDFDEWTDALVEAASTFLNNQMASKKDMDAMVDMIYGMIIEGAYIVTESIALADYPPEMLALMDQQHGQLIFMMKLLNIFRADEEFSEMVDLDERIALLNTLSNFLMVSEFTQHEVDSLRSFIGPEREDILEGRGRAGTLFSSAPELPEE